MNIELYSLLATLVLVATLASVVFAFASYMLFRVREHRKLMRKKAGSGHGASIAAEPSTLNPAAQPAARLQFFKPYEPTH
jgi:hypothetical protein